MKKIEKKIIAQPSLQKETLAWDGLKFVVERWALPEIPMKQFLFFDGGEALDKAN